MITIKQVAQRAGVSASCVSKYLRDENSVRQYNKERIAEAIKSLRYIPSQAARSLRQGKSMMVKAIMPSITLPFFAEIFERMRTAFSDSGYTLILQTIDAEKPFSARDFSGVDGVVVVFPDEDTLIGQIEETLSSMDKPLVALAGHKLVNNIGAVHVDISDGMAQAARYILDCGRSRIAFVGGVESSISSSERYRGFVRVVSPTLQCGVYRRNFSIDWGYEAAKKMVESQRVPDAVLCENDSLAAGVIKFMMTHGVSVPGDIWVAGFDNIPLAEMYTPSISSVSLPSENMSLAAADMLINAMNGGKLGEMQFKTELLLRESTGATPNNAKTAV